MEDDKKLEEFNAQHNEQYSSPPLDLSRPQGTPGRPPSNLTPAEQKVMLELQAKMAASNPNMNINTQTPQVPKTTPAPSTPAYVPPSIQTSGNVCPECGVMHPPLPYGERCPNAKVNLPTIDDAEIGRFIGSWKNIIVSQIEKRQFKEPKKVFQEATILLTKFLEEYSEDKKEEANVESPLQQEREEVS